MAEEPLKRLLGAEAKAEQLIALADDERRNMIEQARIEILELEQRHGQRVKEINSTHLAQAGLRAQQTIAELQRRYAERASALRSSASTMEQHALNAAINLLTGSGDGTS
jgi:V/A-type H+/Na+-transporting ATPase subunit G/H